MVLSDMAHRSRFGWWWLLMVCVAVMGGCLFTAAGCGGPEAGDTETAEAPSFPGAPEGFKAREVFESETPLLGAYLHEMNEPAPGGLRSATLTLYGNGTHRFEMKLRATEDGGPDVTHVNEGTWFTEGTDRLFLSHKRSDGKPARAAEVQLRVSDEGLRMADNPAAPPLRRIKSGS